MFPKINPKQMEKMMSQIGVKQEEIRASEVIIKAHDKNIIIKNPHVMKINMMGQESFQVSGETTEGIGISRDDIMTVALQADVSEKEAEEALRETNGDLAEAIMKLQK